MHREKWHPVWPLRATGWPPTLKKKLNIKHWKEIWLNIQNRRSNLPCQWLTTPQCARSIFLQNDDKFWIHLQIRSDKIWLHFIRFFTISPHYYINFWIISWPKFLKFFSLDHIYPIASPAFLTESRYLSEYFHDETVMSELIFLSHSVAPWRKVLTNRATI